MKLNNDEVMLTAERYLKRLLIHQIDRGIEPDVYYSLQYVLVKKNDQDMSQTIAYAGNNVNMILFNPYEEKEPDVENWTFNFDECLFSYLENGYELAGMTWDCHYNVWCSIEIWHFGDIEYTKGMQDYLLYCKKNSITVEKLRKEMLYSGIDIMYLYDRKLISKPEKPQSHER